MSDVEKLAADVIDVLWNTVLAQRPRWGALLGHSRGAEIWWRSEFALGLESWCWSSDAPGEFGVLSEAKPADTGLPSPKPQMAADLLVAPWIDGKIATTATPRIWIELKERATWWGSSNKAFGTANHGLLHDLSKWSSTKWSDDDAVIAVQLVAHDGPEHEVLPISYQDSLNSCVSGSRTRPARHVGWPLPGEGIVRWLTMESVWIHRPGGES